LENVKRASVRFRSGPLTPDTRVFDLEIDLHDWILSDCLLFFFSEASGKAYFVMEQPEVKEAEVAKDLKEVDEEDEEEEATQPGEASGAVKKKKKKKNKKKKKKGGALPKEPGREYDEVARKLQTNPPTIPVSDLWVNQVFPVGEVHEYRDNNLFRTTSAEKREKDRIATDEWNMIREAAECHRMVRKWAQV
jgi:methionyl aminopeptidase